ncbi:MAG: ATP phosphoribosyltransferase [Gammaproteobacteria bacterium]
MLTLAVSRGRIWDAALPLLRALNLAPDAADTDTRRLVVRTADSRVRLLRVRAQDTPVFVACGAAQAGIAGRDVLAERRMSEIVCPLDLRFARCRLVAAAPPDFRPEEGKTLLVATKYPNLTRAHFAEKGVAADIIKLHGALEIAPQTGVADMIADLADSGRTLRENGLVERETIMRVSAMFIVNRVAARRRPETRDLQRRIAEYVRNAAADSE